MQFIKTTINCYLKADIKQLLLTRIEKKQTEKKKHKITSS